MFISSHLKILNDNIIIILILIILIPVAIYSSVLWAEHCSKYFTCTKSYDIGDFYPYVSKKKINEKKQRPRQVAYDLLMVIWNKDSGPESSVIEPVPLNTMSD